jgi:hypothetical protein
MSYNEGLLKKKGYKCGFCDFVNINDLEVHLLQIQIYFPTKNSSHSTTVEMEVY